MSNPKSLIGFEKHITGDGSPTLSIEGGEKIHSLEGALSESLYVYKPCVEAALQTATPHILSMGLGLGYNEWIASALFLKNDVKKFRICSFEGHPQLREQFVLWLKGQTCPLSSIYDDVTGWVAQYFDIASYELKKILINAYLDEQFILWESLPDQNPWDWKFNAVLYDAFSGETDRHLWTEDHLQNFLQEYCQTKPCFFSTYAATGNLKRSLIAKNFQIEKKGGFGKKRESTFALRT